MQIFKRHSFSQTTMKVCFRELGKVHCIHGVIKTMEKYSKEFVLCGLCRGRCISWDGQRSSCESVHRNRFSGGQGGSHVGGGMAQTEGSKCSKALRSACGWQGVAGRAEYQCGWSREREGRSPRRWGHRGNGPDPSEPHRRVWPLVTGSDLSSSTYWAPAVSWVRPCMFLALIWLKTCTWKLRTAVLIFPASVLLPSGNSILSVCAGGFHHSPITPHLCSSKGAVSTYVHLWGTGSSQAKESFV